jgi:hypothetical protein
MDNFTTTHVSLLVVSEDALFRKRLKSTHAGFEFAAPSFNQYDPSWWVLLSSPLMTLTLE